MSRSSKERGKRFMGDIFLEEERNKKLTVEDIDLAGGRPRRAKGGIRTKRSKNKKKRSNKNKMREKKEPKTGNKGDKKKTNEKKFPKRKKKTKEGKKGKGRKPKRKKTKKKLSGDKKSKKSTRKKTKKKLSGDKKSKKSTRKKSKKKLSGDKVTKCSSNGVPAVCLFNAQKVLNYERMQVSLTFNDEKNKKSLKIVDIFLLLQVTNYLKQAARLLGHKKINSKFKRHRHGLKH